MKSIFVMTYYHLIHSIALALTFDEKPNLYVAKEYLRIDDDFLEKLRKTEIYNSVTGMDNGDYAGSFGAELKLTEGLDQQEIDKIGSSIFEKHLEPYFSEVFENADHEDEFYTYNDHHFSFYYIAKHFQSIIGLEDGYKVLQNKLSVSKPKKIFKLFVPFYGEYYPEPLWRSPKIKKIISSDEYTGNDQYYKERVEVLDFYDLAEKNKNKIREAVLSVFGEVDIRVPQNSTLILSQPLDRSEFCKRWEYYLLMRKTIDTELESGNKVFIKPHPAELLDFNLFSQEGVEILPKNIPSEIFNICNYRFNRGIAFTSTGLAASNNIEEKVFIYEGKEHTYSDYKNCVRNCIEGERINLDFFIIIKEITPESYINIYSYIQQIKGFHININVLLPEKEFNDRVKYFDDRNMGKMKKQYYADKSDTNKSVPWKWHIENMWNPREVMPEDVTLQFLPANDFCDSSIYERFIVENEEIEFFMILDGRNFGRQLLYATCTTLKRSMQAGVFFQNYSYLHGSKIRLGCGVSGNSFSGQISNRVWHKIIKQYIKKDELLEEKFVISLHQIPYSFKIVSHELYFDQRIYTDIQDGINYYVKKLDRIEENSNKIKDPLRKEDYCKGQVGVIFHQYRNWCRLNGIKYDNEELMNLSTLKNSIKLEGMITIAGELLTDSDREYSRKIIKSQELFYYAGDAVDYLLETGKLEKYMKLQKKKKSQSKKKKSFARRGLSKIKRMMTKKPRGTDS